MKYKFFLFGILVLTMATGNRAFSAQEDKPFAPNVDMTTGAIQVPGDYTLWPTLGTWSHANPKGGKPGAMEYHVVYTQPETLAYYQKHRRFPDGAVLVKELLTTQTRPMTTGPAVSHGASIKGWFVLVRDAHGRFKDSKLWGDGWGWSLFEFPNPRQTVSTDYQKDCLACHLPAKQFAPGNAPEADTWIYTFGYPVLQNRVSGMDRSKP